MLPVFMEIAVYRNFLFYARCGAKDFFDKLRRHHADAACFYNSRGKRKKAVRADSLFPKRVDKNVEKER